ncbi:MAG: DUF3011 domain-containing protein [Oscillatoria sp. PMC 1068.18]|nr:DUF3011 domain-containing protein [Oscillatoria sp. PMC 1076.18]MEC4991073.1 DUF3011 domain-containing protein [Oscillatoria sp. PMC 1068.18]
MANLPKVALTTASCLLGVTAILGVGEAVNAQPATIVCESNRYARNFCAMNTYNGVTFNRQLSRSSCNGNWGVGNGFVWVQDGCQAEFISGSYYNNYPDSYQGNRPDRRNLDRQNRDRRYNQNGSGYPNANSGRDRAIEDLLRQLEQDLDQLNEEVRRGNGGSQINDRVRNLRQAVDRLHDSLRGTNNRQRNQIQSDYLAVKTWGDQLRDWRQDLRRRDDNVDDKIKSAWDRVENQLVYLDNLFR